ncbi:MAG: Ig-like domain-containing protein [Armatimonadota bacterium]|nr:Ig-like domain-containing protein [bacterium]
MYVSSALSRILPDGVSTTTVTAVVFDKERRRLSGQSVTWTIDLGAIVSSDSVTNAVGEATATVRSATTADTATISISCGDVTGYDYVEFASDDAPSIRIAEPTNGDTVSGDVKIQLGWDDVLGYGLGWSARAEYCGGADENGIDRAGIIRATWSFLADKRTFQQVVDTVYSSHGYTRYQDVQVSVPTSWGPVEQTRIAPFYNWRFWGRPNVALF